MAKTRTDEDRPGDSARHAESPTDIPAKGWMAVAKRTMAEFKADRGVLMGAGVAFYALLGIFPALIAALTIWGLFADPQQVEDAFETFAEFLPEQAAQIITDQLSAIAGAAGGALGFAAAASLAGALWAASSGMKGLMTAVNAAYNEPADERSFFQERGLALAFALGGILLAFVAVILLAVFPVVVNLIGFEGTLATVVSLARWPLLLVLVWIALSLLYRWAPIREPADWGWLSWGAAIAVVLWLLASIGFTVYVQNFGNYNETYGALGGVIVLMMWLFITGIVILLGAEINAELERTTEHDTTTAPDEPLGRRGALVADQAVGASDEPAGSGDDGESSGRRGSRSGRSSGSRGAERSDSQGSGGSGPQSSGSSGAQGGGSHASDEGGGAAGESRTFATTGNSVLDRPDDDLRRGIAVAVALGALAAMWRFLGRAD
jgi:membrane protein